MSRWTIDATYITQWISQLPEDQRRDTLTALNFLAVEGPYGGRPYIDRIHSSKYHNLKELRPRKAAKNIRILFIFDPIQQAILLVAGDKTGNWEKWYKQNIPLAEERYEQHLKNLEKED
ncbi:diaminopimelate decarboxylase [Rothia nasimurium]|uniref:Diaminopimelate decarboxylase n=1 Tax=Rothia nasimurium TaxID=85336 RepID=A0A4Y9F6K3_9MICC|nr:type II toxin-antitoxin system RelE/ParE family toxin [Rothia nasimurium]MBF0807744.1 type II toxin-antitoxin system RelE/ParE family toxin [Rothia nasimurium]TFU23261.1 diaminopimelate decarboxylase [Rothia nasimurium]